jgi:hypothetical protein
MGQRNRVGYADEAGTAGGHSVRRRAGVGVDGSWSEVRSEGCLSRGIVGRRIGCNAHANHLSEQYSERDRSSLRNKQNEQVDPYGEICQPAAGSAKIPEASIPVSIVLGIFQVS